MSCFVGRIKRKEQGRQRQVLANKMETGIYRCSDCNSPLFDESKKFDAKTGFPSFWLHIGENVQENFLTTYGRERTQLLCKQCGRHLGHLFPNKTTPTQLRYCINANAIYLEQGK